MAVTKTPPKMEFKPKTTLFVGDMININNINYKVKRILNRGRIILKKVNAN